MIRLAVLSDPHLHDTSFGTATEGLVVRSLAASLHSTRIFNESEPALREALRQIAAERIGLCLIAGDLTDDGQPANWAAAAALLAEHAERHRTRFLLCPGNHDQWGIAGKPLVKEVVDAAGRVHRLTGPSVEPEAGTVPCPGMRMSSYAEAMGHARALGYFRDPRDLHWESPFGPSDRIEDREVAMTSPRGDRALVFDASYLVEPVAGLWILSLDANCYLPDGRGGMTDRSPEGWSAALRFKPHLLPWIADVAARAGRLGKRLVAMSHYPMVDVFGGTIPQLDRLGRRRAGRRRMPEPGETAALAATGLGLHFSGHWHVDATAACAGLVNVSVPSTVGFPAGWKLVELGEGVRLTDRPLGEAPGWNGWHDRYHAEAADRDIPALAAPDYTGFLSAHYMAMVLERRLEEDWPPRMRALLDLPLGALPERFGETAAQEPGDLPLREIFLDWYRLREAGGGPAAGLSEERWRLCAALARRFGAVDADGDAGSEAALLAVFFRTLGAHLAAGEAGMRARAELAEPGGVAAC
ncbi:metallophosphoesterase family protein [Wenxinia marina]|uniref:DNA repair exonuclease n=1 Tax=Wenxinia marina DSM 24838 TaxID=1123501 RepID=A0A0D0Q759_9RHOB|nr:metallophosphoesterase [Wenxinia marina]KIQ70244.1 DNA repair exonuclease [Wenxinia marina DSM 24838]GGL50042.1 metallophosphoesterase [Wenxinia marina]